ncbi:MAG: hypothetical protein LBS72_01625 [Oscillospiraceae bacterium]|jgi:hypothetical protein|nr:hypothetical protein [Oscillospiraceae bacterium]
MFKRIHSWGVFEKSLGMDALSFYPSRRRALQPAFTRRRQRRIYAQPTQTAAIPSWFLASVETKLRFVRGGGAEPRIS